MNKKLTTLLCTAALATGFATGAYAASKVYIAGEGVNASPHNINRIVPFGDVYDKGNVEGRVCAYCHTPHHASQDPTLADYNPLWSHEVTAGTFNPYKSSTFDPNNKHKIVDPIVGPSRLCMSCHDGVVAIDEHYGSVGKVVKNSGNTWGGIDVGDAVGATVTNTHPIGFSFVDAATDNAVNGIYQGIYPITREFTVTIGGAGLNGVGATPVNDGKTPMWKTGVTNATGQVTRTVGDLMWPNPNDGNKLYMTCASCHDVHNKENPESYLLINVQTESKICLTCHNK